MKFRRMFVNPLDFKWSGTVKLSLFKSKQDEERHAAILPVLVMRDTPEARRLLAAPVTQPEAIPAGMKNSTLRILDGLRVRELMEANIENAHALSEAMIVIPALHRELKATADKLDWLYEQQETDGEISARDLFEIRKQLKAARLTIKNLNP